MIVLHKYVHTKQPTMLQNRSLAANTLDKPYTWYSDVQSYAAIPEPPWSLSLQHNACCEWRRRTGRLRDGGGAQQGSDRSHLLVWFTSHALSSLDEVTATLRSWVTDRENRCLWLARGRARYLSFHFSVASRAYFYFSVGLDQTDSYFQSSLEK